MMTTCALLITTLCLTLTNGFQYGCNGIDDHGVGVCMCHYIGSKAIVVDCRGHTTLDTLPTELSDTEKELTTMILMTDTAFCKDRLALTTVDGFTVVCDDNFGTLPLTTHPGHPSADTRLAPKEEDPDRPPTSLLTTLTVLVALCLGGVIIICVLGFAVGVFLYKVCFFSYCKKDYFYFWGSYNYCMYMLYVYIFFKLSYFHYSYTYNLS